MAAIIGYSNQLDENFYYGANVKFIYSGIEDHYSTGLAVDSLLLSEVLLNPNLLAVWGNL